MSFLFTVFDIILTLIMLFDTLGMIYQFRKGPSPSSTEYVRLCASWILFLTICSLFSCNRKGFFGTLLRIIFLAAKVFVTIPKFGGSLKIHKFLIEDKNALRYYEQAVKFAKSKLSGKVNFSASGSSIPSTTFESDTSQPERSNPSENQGGEDHGDTVDE